MIKKTLCFLFLISNSTFADNTSNELAVLIHTAVLAPIFSKKPSIDRSELKEKVLKLIDEGCSLSEPVKLIPGFFSSIPILGSYFKRFCSQDFYFLEMCDEEIVKEGIVHYCRLKDGISSEELISLTKGLSLERKKIVESTVEKYLNQ